MEVMLYAKGISWINDCRISFTDDINFEQTTHQKTTGDKYGGGKGFHKEPILMKMYKPQGRFPANILVCDDMLNDGVVGGSSYCPPTKYEYEMSEDKFNSGGRRTKTGIGDKGSNSRYYSLDKWFDQLLEL